MCPNCGMYDCEQDHSDPDYLTITCLKCHHVWTLEKYRDEGQDKWRDPRDESY